MPSLRHKGVEIAPQFTHSRPSVKYSASMLCTAFHIHTAFLRTIKQSRRKTRTRDSIFAVRLAAALSCVGAVPELTVCRFGNAPYCVVSGSLVGDAYVQEAASTAAPAVPVVFC